MNTFLILLPQWIRNLLQLVAILFVSFCFVTAIWIIAQIAYIKENHRDDLDR